MLDDTQEIVIPSDVLRGKLLNAQVNRRALIKLLLTIETYQAEKKYPPSLRELLELTGVSSLSVISNRLYRLEKLGLLRRSEKQCRTMVVTYEGQMACKALREKLE